jgi:hypothetical protein
MASVNIATAFERRDSTCEKILERIYDGAFTRAVLTHDDEITAIGSQIHAPNATEVTNLNGFDFQTHLF